MRSLWRAVVSATCGLAILLIGGVSYSSGQEKKAVGQETEIFKRYREAAKKGGAQAQFEFSVMCENGIGVPQDYVEAARWYRKAADQGHADAQYGLGRMYALGRGMPQDWTEAARWYRKAADQGEATAQHNLGLLYLRGEGVPHDFAEAARWWRKAADQGHAAAQFFLGTTYVVGRGAPQDFVEAHMWFNLAGSRASGDDREFYADSREALAKQMTPEQIAEAQRRAREWKPKTGEDKGGGPVK